MVNLKRFSSYSIGVLFVLYSLINSCASADVLLNVDFETGNLLDNYMTISGNKTGVEISDNRLASTPACTGHKALQATLPYGPYADGGNFRAEMTMNQPPYNEFQIGERHWLSVNIYIADDYVHDIVHDEVLFQLHGRPDVHLGEKWRNPPFAIRTNGDTWIVSFRKDSKQITYSETQPKDYEASGYYTPPMVKGKWTSFIVETLWDYRPQGYLKVWIDGDLVVNRTGGVGFNDVEGPWLKAGIYKSGWRYREPGDVIYRQVHIDDIKLGDSSATYNQMYTPCDNNTPPLNQVINKPTGVQVDIKSN